jgi:hypothetical protein
MKNISIKIFACTFFAAGILAGCTSENTTGVETENIETTTESQPNMGGKTGDSADIDSSAVNTDNSTSTQNNGNATDHSGHDHNGAGNN